MGWFERASHVVVAGHCRVELAAALNRQRREGVFAEVDYRRILGVIDADLGEFEVVPLTGSVEARAILAMERMPLSGMDALHVGCADVARVDVFVTADARQAKAAEAAGLRAALVEA